MATWSAAAAVRRRPTGTARGGALAIARHSLPREASCAAADAAGNPSRARTMDRHRSMVMWISRYPQRTLYRKILRRHPEVLAALRGEPRRMGHKRLRPSFETPRKIAAPQDDGGDWFADCARNALMARRRVRGVANRHSAAPFPMIREGLVQPEGDRHGGNGRPRGTGHRGFFAASRRGVRHADRGPRGAAEARKGRSGGQQRAGRRRVLADLHGPERDAAAAGDLSGQPSGARRDGDISGAHPPYAGSQPLPGDFYVRL